MALSFRPIRPLLKTGTSTASRWLSYVGLGVGVLLLLCAIQMFVNLYSLLREGNIRRNGFDYVAITKTITNETMGDVTKNLFRQPEIDELKAQPFIQGVSPLESNQFRVQLSAGQSLPFQTDMFLETLENEFIDTVPPSFSWQQGQQNLPIILSADFLEIYNVFAPAQDLPQISKETATSIPVQVTCYGNGLSEVFIGRIVAFSDRVNSVLVPKTFLDWANARFGEQKKELEAGRIYIKTKDANSTELLTFLDSKGYRLNKDKTILGRNKILIESIFSGLGVFGLLVVILALMLFSFYLQLVIARSKDSLQLLLTLGYSPRWLGKHVSGRFVPVYLFIIGVALCVTQLMQWAFHQFIMYNRSELSSFVHWSVVAVAAFLVLLSVFTNARLVKRLLYKLGN